MRTVLIAAGAALILMAVLVPIATFAQEAAGSAPAKARSCIPIYDWDTTECLLVPAVSWMGGVILSLGAFILRLAGTIFDVLLTHIIVDFRGSLDALGITYAIDLGWSVFRDLANALMIWMFVFIAISIILGVQEFGQKKYVAKVLIIAVLINFSLLFTKMIIDASNFVAYQIYHQVAGQQQDGQPYDMAAGFLKPMGITGVGDSQKMLTNNFNTKTIGGAAQIFLFSIIGFFLLIGIALVFLYGCFLILVRAILLIMLMIASAPAFLTYLIPHLANGEYGWTNWWKTLINVSVFAPLLMLLLWISTRIVQSAGEKRAGTLGSIIADPASQLVGNGWTIIMIYLLTIGLLLVSFKIANSVAGSISGFNFTKLGLGQLAAAPIAMGLGLGGAAVSRIRNRDAYRYEKQLEDQMKAVRRNSNLSAADRINALNKLQNKLLNARKVGTKDYNPMNKPVATSLTDKLGLSGILAGRTAHKPYGETVKEEAKKEQDKFKNLALTKEDKKALRDEALNNIDKRPEVSKAMKDEMRAEAALNEARETNKAQRAAAEKMASAAQQQKEAVEAAHQPEKEKVIEEHTKEVERIEQKYDSGDLRKTIENLGAEIIKNQPGTDLDQKRRELAQAEEREKSMMRQRDVEIKEAQAKTHERTHLIDDQIAAKTKTFAQDLTIATSQLSRLAAVEKPLEDKWNAAKATTRKVREDARAQIEQEVNLQANEYTSTLQKAVEKHVSNPDVAREITVNIQKAQRVEQQRAVLEHIIDEEPAAPKPAEGDKK